MNKAFSSSFFDYELVNSIKFIFNDYKQKVYFFRNNLKTKKSQIGQINLIILNKKNVIKELIKDIELNDIDINLFKTNKELEKLPKNKRAKQVIINEFIEFNNNKIENNKLTITEQKNLLEFLKYSLENINYDITHLNDIKKDLKSLFNHYDNINLYYDNNAKITYYDIKELDNGFITDNIKQIVYCYIIALKLNKTPLHKELTKNDIITKLNNILFKEDHKPLKELELLDRRLKGLELKFNKWF